SASSAKRPRLRTCYSGSISSSTRSDGDAPPFLPRGARAAPPFSTSPMIVIRAGATHGVHLARRAKQTAKLLGRRRGRRTRANANLRALALGGLTDDLDRRHTAVRDVDAVRVDQLRGRKADTQRAIGGGQRGAQRLEARLQRR